MDQYDDDELIEELESRGYFIEHIRDFFKPEDMLTILAHYDTLPVTDWESQRIRRKILAALKCL